jgi:WD40 repeat protein
VYAAAFSPDGTRLVTGGEDAVDGGEVRLWDATTGAPLASPLPHNSPVSTIHFRPDGLRFLSGTKWKGEVQLWETATALPVGETFRCTFPVLAASFSPSGKDICIGGPNVLVDQGWKRNDAGIACLIDARPRSWSGPELRVNAEVSALAWRKSDGKAILCAGTVAGGESEVRLWDAATGEPLGPALRYRGSVLALAFSADGRTGLIGGKLLSGQGEVRLCDPINCTYLGAPLPHPQPVLALAFSPDGRTVLTGCEDGLARFWDTASGRELRKIEHPYPVKALAFSPDGKKVLTGTSEEAQLWDAASGKALDTLMSGHIDSIAFSPDAKQAQVVGWSMFGASILLWDVEGKKGKNRIMEYDRLPLRYQTIDFSSDGETLMMGGIRGTLQEGFSTFVDYRPDDRTREPFSFLPPGAEPIWHGPTFTFLVSAFSPDGRAVVTNAPNRSARIWRVPPPVPAEVSPERINLWVQLSTGYELSEKDGLPRRLDSPTLRRRRQRLDELGGPPFRE